MSVEGGRNRQADAGKSPDRLEQESIEFHRRVVAAYERLASAEPARYVRLDATGSRESIHSAVMARVQPLVDAIEKG